MFTGLVEETGTVEAIENRAGKALRLKVRAHVVAQDYKIGDSIAVNGCCLTATEHRDGVFTFDLLAETVDKTSFGSLQPGARVNLERSLTAGSRMGGHFVSGHIDSTGSVRSVRHEGDDRVLHFDVPAAFRHYLVYKGSVAVDGVSLTVAGVDEDGFHVWLIPHTLQVTSLGQRQQGDRVNLEFDLLAKYVERILQRG